MTSHTDYCPIAVGVDVLGDRWTPLVIRELMVGASGFNEIHRGIPRASRTLLAQRLRQLERYGLVDREVNERGRAGRYALTPAGEALTPIVWAMGHWAAEWVFGDPTDEDCDGLSLIWRMHQHAVPAKLPATRTIVHLVLTGTGGAQGWLDIERRGISVCKDDQGHDVDLAVEADTAQMHRWLLGLVPFRDLVANGQARLIGPSRLARSFPTWFDTTFFADGLRRAEQRRAQLARHDRPTPADGAGDLLEGLPDSGLRGRLPGSCDRYAAPADAPEARVK
jgi:DNA-binding HxlR family transcriptional regulator